MELLSNWLSEHAGLEGWMATLLAIALVTVVVNQLAQVLLRHAARASERTASAWDDALVRSASRPLLAATWVVGLGFMARVLQREVQPEFIAEALELRDVLLVLCAAWFLLHFAGRVGHNIIERHTSAGEEVDRTTVDALVKLARLVVVVVAVLIVAQTLGFQIGGLLALGGVGGIAVGFAARDLLANFFGGLTVYLDRPFSVGEWIRSPDKAIEGIVEHISWRHTRVRAFNCNPIYVPNALFTSIVVENPSRMSHRRIRETIGVRYDDFHKVDAITAGIRRMLLEHPDIDHEAALVVNFNQFGPSSLDIMLVCFTRITAWEPYQSLKQEVLLRVGRLIESQGAQIAFPTQTLHVHGAARDSGDAWDDPKPIAVR